ncbi:MAG: heme-binding domain-containing protein [candidate division Zixibacteria bacterium]|nr:heme-binding domain-containing protein [candidate division Zixibacteria bacterium]
MQSDSIQRLVKGFLVLGLLLIVPGVSTFSNGGKKHDNDDKNDKKETAETTLSDSVKIIQDSVYATINNNYQTVRHIFKKSCFDCHTDSTKYPWYHVLPFIGGMIDDDIKEAKEHLDMSNDFPFGGHATQIDQLSEIREDIKEGKMPILSYRLPHWALLIEGKKQDSVFLWIEESIKLLQQLE